MDITIETISILQEYHALYFCETCGTHMCYNLVDHDSWHVLSAAVDRSVGETEQVSGTLQQIAEHMFVGDTSDGGLACLLTGSSGASVAPSLFLGPSGNSPWLLESVTDYSADVQKVDRLLVVCHRRGIQFHVHRPKESSRALSAPWLDLLQPYHTFDSSNPDDVKWWVRGDKDLAGICACRTCRLAFASPITCWAFIPRAKLSNVNGGLWDVSGGTLTSFESSKGIHRGFCLACGASIFWRSDERPDLLDISVGVMHAGEGSLARSWLEWRTSRVSFAEDVVEKDLIHDFERKLYLLNGDKSAPENEMRGHHNLYR